jgi:His/Glu/Gln/Arg/opine family amino acid ABC transporter permease subunit
MEILPSVPFILEGMKVTLAFAGVSVVFGFILGLGLTFVKISSRRWVRFLGAAYTSIFRGTPLILQLAIIYHALPQVLNIDISGFQAGILTFSLNSAAYVSEIIRAGIESIDKGQREASMVLGISYTDMMKDIIWPQAFRRILPSLVNETIDLLKESAIVSTIGEADLLRRASMVSAEKYTYLEPLLIAGACYYVMVMILTLLAKRLERALNYS